MNQPPIADSAAWATSERQPEAHASGPGAARDFVLGSVIAVVMVILFVVLSSGHSLRVTFVPGVAFAWLAFVWLHMKRVPLPSADRVVPIFFTVLSIQFLHFAEEYRTGFNAAFPSMYGGEPFPLPMFVTFNMGSYAVFAISCLLVVYTSARPMLMPALFFAVYGAIGNAVSHTWWVILTGGYFPGFWTALAYWIAGPWLLFRLTGSRLATASLAIGFAVVLVALLTAFAV